MPFSPYTREVIINFNDDHTLTDQSLEDLAFALDLNIITFDSPISQNDGTTIISKGLQTANKSYTWYAYQKISGQNSSLLVLSPLGWTGTYYYLGYPNFVSGSTLCVKNISENTKIFWYDTITHFLTEGKNKNNETILFSAYLTNSNKAYCNINNVHYEIPQKEKSSITGNTTIFEHDYCEMMPVQYPLLNCYLNNLYYIDTENLEAGDVFKIED